jgi:hypothetical protein
MYHFLHKAKVINDVTVHAVCMATPSIPLYFKEDFKNSTLENHGAVFCIISNRLDCY